jgi:transporter family-2 protein
VPKFPFILAAIVIGGVLTLQPGLNADVARRLGNPFAAGVVSIFVSLTVSAAVMLALRPHANWAAIGAMPWYLWLAGTVGVVFVVGTLWLAPVLGAATMFASVVAGQLIMATAADHFAFGGYQGHPVDIWRIAGIVCVLAGVWLFSRTA